MNYKKQISAVQKYIDRLKEARNAIREIEDSVLSIERGVGEIDQSLPDADRLFGEEREQVLHLYDLTREAFDLVDDIIGPPQDEFTGTAEGTTYIPEARGNGAQLSLDEILQTLKKGPGHHAS